MTVDEAYATLGLKRAACAAEVRAAYRKAALRTHPDRGGNAVDFGHVCEAYKVIQNPALASQPYDPDITTPFFRKMK